MTAPQKEQRPPSGNRRRPEAMPGGALWVLILVLVLLVLGLLFWRTTGLVDYKSEFIDLLVVKGYEAAQAEAKKEDKKPNAIPNAFIEELEIIGRRVQGQLTQPAEELALPETLQEKIPQKTFVVWVPDSEIQNGALTSKLDKYGVNYRSRQEQWNWGATLVLFLLPTALLIGLFVLFVLPRFRDPLGGGFLSSYIKSPARRYEKTKGRVTFDDVADMEYANSELQEIVEYLKTPQKFQRLGAQVPKGVLLIGPPGTGKTLLARATAGEAGVRFFSISGSEFIQMFVGVGASRVRDLFKTAKDTAPCLIFIDEIDAVGRMRGAGVGGGSDEREQTLNQILSEMDGFQPNESIIVLAATNRPDVLDSALLRPGRFDRHVTIDRPTWQGRKQILEVHTRNKPLDEGVDLEQIARTMIGMTGADLRNLCNEAALLATREGKHRIGRVDFEHAADRVLMGPKREEVLTTEGKQRTAYHEAGHALVGWLEPECDPPLKISIVPRGRALGVVFSLPEEERFHHGLDYFKARLAQVMGGRAADRLIYGQAFSGHEDDLKQATKIARYMVTHWGMSDRLGPMALRIGEEHVFLDKEIQEARDFSESTAAVIDEEIQKLLREADERAEQLLASHRDLLDKLVEALLDQEELYREQIKDILGPNTTSNVEKNGQKEETTSPQPSSSENE
ncbi:MAG: ATP-dependent zinc metalloprotease FtsH [Gemmataceae bacterium]